MNTKLMPFDLDKVKNGAKIVTRSGLSARIVDVDDVNNGHPVLCLVTWKDGIETPILYSTKGRYYPDHEDDRDLFIEEEEQEKTRREYSGTDSIYVPKDDEGIREELIDAINGLWDNDALPMPLSMKRKDAWITWLQKQGEEKPADNKPKFQEGDWVVFNPGCNAHQIIRVVENATSRHTYGYDTVDNYYFNDTVERVRRWDINDAKDGDVLVNGSNIFIFHFINDTRIMGYCHVNTYDDGFYIDLGKNDGVCLIDDVVTPATKEQCDLLFQRMKEEGYMWNSDKKELHKIDPKFKVGDKVVLKSDKSLVGSITLVSFIGTYCIHFKDFNAGWYSEQELEPCEMIEKDVKTRRMTNQELSWWLRDCPQERREVCREDEDTIYSRYIYRKCDADEEVPDFVRIRKNGGEWIEPLIEE